MLIERADGEDADASKRGFFAPVSAADNEWISQLALPVSEDDEL